MPRPRDPRVVWDATINGFRTVEPDAPPAKVDERAPWNKKRKAAACLSSLLKEAFRVPRGRSSVHVPEHLRPFIK